MLLTILALAARLQFDCPLYLVCHYQHNTITLQQALPAGISYCRVNQRDRYTLFGLICRT